jgi:hypothetical protein
MLSIRLAQDLGYPAAFLILGSLAIASAVLWIMFASAIQQASAVSADAPAAEAIATPARRATGAR